MLFCFFNSLPNGEYSSLLIAVFSGSLHGKLSSSVKNLYVPIFPDDKAEVLDIFMSKLY